MRLMLVLVALAAGACRPGTNERHDVVAATGGPSPVSTRPVAESDSIPVIVAVGDIVCGTRTESGIPCLHARNAALVAQLAPSALLLLGDTQYEEGALEDYGAFFEPTFGQFRGITFPVPGNHEYVTKQAAGYFDYFNGTGADSGRAGARGRGWYSFDIGAWHVVALNSNCDEVGGCRAGSPQERWLRADLAAHPARCTLAYWHSARFSSGAHGDDINMRAIWRALYDADADLVLSAHDHDYERFGPQDANGKLDAARGIRSFVVGTGGKGTGQFERAKRNSEVRANNSIGVLRLVLRPDGYDWRFVPVPGFPLDDGGSDACHGAGLPPPALALSSP